MMTATRKAALSTGVTLAYDDIGEGTPVLFIHGWPHNRSLWAGQLQELGSVARCIAPDLRGFGASDVAGPYSIDQYADDLGALLDALNIESAIVCGLSMGGYVALSLYRRHRARVRALILTSTRATADTDEARGKREKLITFVNEHGVAPLATRQLPAMVGESTLNERPEITERLRQIMADAPRDGVTGALRAMADRRDSSELLELIDVPTAVINGEEDTFTPTAEMQAMAAAIPYSSFFVIPESGHVCAFEQPLIYNIAVKAFIEYVEEKQGRYISPS